MPEFPAALSAALSDASWSQADLARAAKLPPPQISKFISGDKPPGVSVVEKIARALPEKHRPSVLIAWIRDRMPPSARELVTLGERTGKSTRAFEDLPADLRAAFERLARLAAKHKSVAAMIRSTDATLRRQ